MQNIPGIAIEKAHEQLPVVKIATVKKDAQSALFADLFNEHANKVEEDLAMTPVCSTEKMLESGPNSDDTEEAVNAAGNEISVSEEKASAEADERENRMTQEDLEEVRDDLEKYGMTEEEIAKIEEKVNSEEGLTWGQFTSIIAHKMAEMRTNEFSDEQKDSLNGFFSKFGFTSKESDKLIGQLEKGHFSKVMNSLQKKLESMPQDQQLLLDKDGIESFSAALGFSKEFTAKLQELFAANSLPKDVKNAFSLMRQEMKAMDARDQELVRAVAKGFVKAMGDTAKESSAARQIAEAIDLKPRVAEEGFKSEAEMKGGFQEAVQGRKDSIPAANVRKQTEKNLAEQVEIKPEATPKEETAHDKPEAESEEHWTALMNKMQNNGSSQATAVAQSQVQTKAAEAAQVLTTGLSQAETASKSNAWEKVSAPKVMAQVDQAFIKTLNSGAKQLTLQLTPENLGKLSIVLQVNGKEIGATIRAENADAAKIITENLDIIKTSLENQGLKVEKLDVQTGLANDQNQQEWFGQEEHNMSRDREAMIAMRNHMKNMRGSDGVPVAQDLQQLREQANNAAHGLHVIA